LRHVPLKDTLLKLRTYMGEQVKPMGFCNTTVQCKGQCKELPIYVMKNEGPTLFGREWLDTIPALRQLLSKHAIGFCEGLGRMKNIQAQIHLEGGSRPRFWKARPIALACKPAVSGYGTERTEG